VLHTTIQEARSMKRSALILSVAVLLSLFAFAQDPAPAQGKAAPMAKTQEELDAYTAALAPPEMRATEAAVDQFAKQYPDSELRATAYSQLMQKYQQANNVEATIAAGRKAIAADPEHTVSLAVTAMALADNTIDTTPSRDERLLEATKDADAAIATIQNDRWVIPEVGPEQVEKIRNTLLATAYMAKGLALKSQKDYAGSETAFKAAIASNKGVQDPAALLHLSLAQDYLKKYDEATANVNAAIAAADAQKNTQIAALARKQQARLKAIAAQQPKTARKRK
jgi:tetratricopeptide (TPR) repeat protein